MPRINCCCFVVVFITLSTVVQTNRSNNIIVESVIMFLHFIFCLRTVPVRTDKLNYLLLRSMIKTLIAIKK